MNGEATPEVDFRPRHQVSVVHTRSGAWQIERRPGQVLAGPTRNYRDVLTFCRTNKLVIHDRFIERLDGTRAIEDEDGNEALVPESGAVA